MSNEVSYEDFKTEWLSSIREGDPSSIETGRRFARKLITQWRDVDESTDDIVYCDGSGDGGIDVAFLERGDAAPGDETGDTWFLVQSKFGKAFQGAQTLLAEGQKVIDTLDGQRPRLSSLAEGLVERLANFRARMSERDRIVLVFATDDPMSDDLKRVMADLQAMGRGRLGTGFDVDAVSIEVVYKRMLEGAALIKTRVNLKASLVSSGAELLVGSTSLVHLYEFMKLYRAETGDLDQLYEKNVRKFLGLRGRVNRAISGTLRDTPERFGLFNNGITIVVEDFGATADGEYSLVEPYVVNGCQTTRTIWEVFHARMEAGGTGTDDRFNGWRTLVDQGVVVVKIAKVGATGEALLQLITRHTNTQNAIREKDFLALTSDFRTWARLMEENYHIYLEIQRGGWDSRRALQRQRPEIQQFTHAANAFDLLKVYGAGWLSEAGLAFSKNAPFLPNGSVFKRILGHDGEDASDSFGAEDLYAAHLLQDTSEVNGFGRRATKASRKQTKFLFYYVVIELLKDAMNRSDLPASPKDITRALAKLLAPPTAEGATALVECAMEAVDSYLTKDTDNCAFDEPLYTDLNYDLNAFLKSDKLGKDLTATPRFRDLLAITHQTMGYKAGTQPARRQLIAAAVLA